MGYLRVSASKKGTLSLFKQRCIIFGRLEKMAHETARRLMDTVSDLILENREISTILGVV